MTIKAQRDREIAPRSGALRRVQSRRPSRAPLVGAELKPEEMLPAPPAGDEAVEQTAAGIRPDLLDNCTPDKGIRFAARTRAGWRERGLAANLVSFLAHAAAVAGAVMFFTAPSEFPAGGEEAIPVELVVAGAAVERSASEEGAKTPDVQIDPPTLPDVAPPEIGRELAQVEVPPPPEPPPLEIPAETPRAMEIATIDLPPVPDAPPLADLTPPVLAVAPTPEPAPAIAPPVHTLPKPPETPKAVETPKPQPPKPQPKKIEARKVEPRKVATQQPTPKPERPAQPMQASGASERGDSDATRTASTRGSVGASGPTSGAAAVANYRSQVMAHLQRYKRYPEAARERGVTGRVVVAFTLSRGGQVVAASLAGSSGAAMLDQETLAMVRRAAPFPAMPDGGPGSMSFSAGITYNLR
ncbi:energy transducer TonB [Terrarubrum flagellatum]|uniref:energy transducer TonB n=1 Tax=Terrirubrum flagellatum TaxID=2895980 RepID=UPI0031453D31